MVTMLVKQDKIQVLTVYLGKHVFGIPIHNIQDVLSTLHITGLPQANCAITGVANLRGRIVTAIDLSKRFGEKYAGNDPRMNVVLESKGELYSLIVDNVGDVLTLDDTSIEDAPMTLNAAWRGFTQGVHQLEKTIMVILDPEKIIHMELAGDRT